MEVQFFTKQDLPHYYIFGKLFIDYNEAVSYCDQNNIPYDFIVKTKYIIEYKHINN